MKDILHKIAHVLIPLVLFAIVVLYAYITKRPDIVLLFVLLFFAMLYMNKAPLRVLVATLIIFAGLGLVFFIKGIPKKISSSHLHLTSSSFQDKTAIPALYTCKGDNISPELNWSVTSPIPVESYVLVVDDPDAQKVIGKTFVHWIAVFPGTVTHIPEGTSGKLTTVDRKAFELPNHYKKTVYQGPCPPAGSGKHVYRFTLFATTKPLHHLTEHFLQAPCTAESCRQTLGDNIIAETILTGHASA